MNKSQFRFRMFLSIILSKLNICINHFFVNNKTPFIIFILQVLFYILKIFNPPISILLKQNPSQDFAIGFTQILQLMPLQNILEKSKKGKFIIQKSTRLKTLNVQILFNQPLPVHTLNSLLFIDHLPILHDNLNIFENHIQSSSDFTNIYSMVLHLCTKCSRSLTMSSVFTTHL